MELLTVNSKKKQQPEDLSFLDVTDEIVESEIQPETANTKHFIESNTQSVSYQHLKNDCTIPVFSKDNECTIAHQEFIQVVKQSAEQFFGGHSIHKPEIRVSHVVKGRIPEAIGKPAKDLLDHEKTIYYERMAFIMEIPSITETINGNQLNLTIGGVRAYNHENLYSRKTIEKFKVFVGFQNKVCTNLCISTDGYADELRVSHIGELQTKVLSLFQGYSLNSHIQEMNDLTKFQLTEQQFAQLIGKTRLYQYLPSKRKLELPSLDFNDSQINTVARDYYQDKSFCREADGSINLWKLYNLFTGANKSSYIDSFLNRTVNAYSFTKGVESALKGNGEYGWFLN